MLSVYRSNRDMLTLEEYQVISGTSSMDDVALLGLSYKENRPVLINFNDDEAIAKQQEADDGDETFESLYDRCITIADLKRMREAKVDSPRAMPLCTFKTWMNFRIGGEFQVPLFMIARDSADLYARIHKAFDEDAMFRQAVIEHLFQTIRADMEFVFSMNETERMDGNEEGLPAGRSYQIGEELE